MAGMTGKAIATPGGPPAAVLVHGAWHGAWCWGPAVAALAADGISAVAIDLPGHGNDPGPMGDLHGDAAHVAAVLDALTRVGPRFGSERFRGAADLGFLGS